MTKRIYNTKDGKELEILSNHVTTQGGNFKGVCVSALLAYFGIQPNQYKYTWSKKTGNNYTAILRRFGFAVRSRKSVFKKYKTVGAIRKGIAQYQDYKENVNYVIEVEEHVLLLNSKGETIVDTAPRLRDRRRVYNVRAIFKT